MGLSSIVRNLMPNFARMAKSSVKLFSAYASALSLAVAPVVLSCETPSPDQQQQQGCTQNYECKKDRVCYHSKCVYPEEREEQPQPREEQPDCRNGQQQETQCDLLNDNNNGKLEQLCIRGQWEYGECRDPDECRLGEQRTSYSGSPSTADVGECKSKLEECVTQGDKAVYTIKRQERVPGQERCDERDNDCDGVTDEEVILTLYEDQDGDDFGNPDTEIQQCERQRNLVENGSDCDDTNRNIKPGAVEYCGNDIDENCDRAAEECINKLVVNAGAGGESYFVIMNSDGTNKVGIPNTRNWGFNPSWSPEARQIVFEGAGPGIYKINVDGTNRVQLIDHGEQPVWSPNGQKIAYGCGGQDICVVDFDGRNQIKITDYDSIHHYYRQPAWSPDSRKLVFQLGLPSQQPTQFDIAVIDVNGENERNLTNDQAEDMYPAWSPDGQKIVFTSYMARDRSGLYTINPDGSDKQLIVDLNNCWYPTWSPDSRKIAFVRTGNLYVVDKDGRNLVNIVDGGYSYPEWSPLVR